MGQLFGDKLERSGQLPRGHECQAQKQQKHRGKDVENSAKQFSQLRIQLFFRVEKRNPHVSQNRPSGQRGFVGCQGIIDPHALGQRNRFGRQNRPSHTSWANATQGMPGQIGYHRLPLSGPNRQIQGVERQRARPFREQGTRSVLLAQRYHGLRVQQRPQQTRVKNKRLTAGQQLAVSIVQVEVGFGEGSHVFGQGDQRGPGRTVRQQVALVAQALQGELPASLISTSQVALVGVDELAGRSHAHHQ